MLDIFIQELKPLMQHKLLKDNPSNFSDACTIVFLQNKLVNLMFILGKCIPLRMHISNTKINAMECNIMIQKAICQWNLTLHLQQA